MVCLRAPASAPNSVLGELRIKIRTAYVHWERETRNPALGTERICGLAEDWGTILPLPWGEGRGEGEGDVRVPKVCPFKNSDESLVAHWFSAGSPDRSHPSPLIPLPVEGRGKSVVALKCIFLGH